jgi:hypothetical protein
VQWFERARLEIHPENPAAFQVLGGLLGSEVLAHQPPVLVPVAPPPAPPSRACTATPGGERSVTHKGIILSAAGFRFRDEVAGVQSTADDDFLTMTVSVNNYFYRRPDGSPARIFATVDSFLLYDTAGRSYPPDDVTAKLNDRFVSGQVRPGEQRTGKLAFRIPKDAIPAQLIYNGPAISPELPRVRLDLEWPGC